MQRFRFVWPLLIALFLLHPLLVGIPGRIDSFRFGRHLSYGQPSDEVEKLRNATSPENGRLPFSESYGSPVVIRYMTWGSFCIEGGEQYALVFDSEQRLRSWSVEDWTDGC